jgi:hypothetical protein
MLGAANQFTISIPTTAQAYKTTVYKYITLLHVSAYNLQEGG